MVVMNKESQMQANGGKLFYVAYCPRCRRDFTFATRLAADRFADKHFGETGGVLLKGHRVAIRIDVK